MAVLKVKVLLNSCAVTVLVLHLHDYKPWELHRSNAFACVMCASVPLSALSPLLFFFFSFTRPVITIRVPSPHESCPDYKLNWFSFLSFGRTATVFFFFFTQAPDLCVKFAVKHLQKLPVFLQIFVFVFPHCFPDICFPCRWWKPSNREHTVCCMRW